MTGDPGMLLWLTVFIPLLGAALCRAACDVPRVRDAISLLTATGLFALVVFLATRYFAGEALVSPVKYVLPELPLALSVEPLGLIFALVASFLWIITTLYAIGYMNGNQEKHQTRFFACFALSIACAMGIAFADNLFTLFLFYEGMTLSTYPLVTHKGNAEAKQGGRTYLSILMGTSIGFFLLAMVWTYQLTGTLDFTEGGILQGRLSPVMNGVLLLLFMYGIGKAALMPFHRWLPAAMVAPTPVSALLHAVAVVKAGVFSIVKILVYIFGIPNLHTLTELTFWAGDFLVYIAGATIILASIVALQEDNLKRRLAYSTISQLSYVIMSVAMFSPNGVIGASLHIAAHAFGKITLFFTAGAIYTASKKTKVSELNGIGRRMPFTMLMFAVGALSMVGVPPTVGFVSKWYILTGAMQTEYYFVIAEVILSTLLNAAYFLPIVYMAFFRKEDVTSVKGDHGEAPWRMVLALMITGLMTLGLFFFPDLPLRLAQEIPL